MQKIAYILCLLRISLNTLAEDNIPSNNVERAKLAKKVERRIAIEYGMVEAIMPQINVYLKKGEKVQAREMVDDALERIARIEADQQLLAQLDETADDETLMLAETQETKRYLSVKAGQLRNAIGVFISCEAKLFDSNYTSLEGEIEGDLSEFGVFFVDSIGQADWAVSITSLAREYRKVDYGSTSSYTTYVEAKLSIEKVSTGKRIYEDILREKGIHTMNYEQAAHEAYKLLSPHLSAIIKEQIQK